MKLVRPAKRRQSENMVALINVVFLLLVFFLVAGTLAAPPDNEVDLVSLSDKGAAPPPDMVFVRPDGTITWQGEVASVGKVVANWRETSHEDERPLRIAADRELPAVELIATIRALRTAGAGRIVLVTEHEVK
ncbi:MAG: biopolymer transporter ExbD [Nitratireductor sp.]|nr:biopolymer transporter ExbD [Nitratireductor sp.]